MSVLERCPSYGMSVLKRFTKLKMAFWYIYLIRQLSPVIFRNFGIYARDHLQIIGNEVIFVSNSDFFPPTKQLLKFQTSN